MRNRLSNRRRSLSFTALVPKCLYRPISPVTADCGEEHGVGSLVVRGAVAEFKTVEVNNVGALEAVQETGPGNVSAAAFKGGDGQAARQIALQRNEAGSSLRFEIGQRFQI